MRKSITIDDDVHQFASIYAQAKGITLSAAVGELIRMASSTPYPPPEIQRSPNGLPSFPPTGNALTPQMVKDAESEIG
jgi:hypothetical protein